MAARPSYALRIEPREHYLYAHVEGPEDTVAISIAYWSEIAAACAGGTVKRLLVVEELAGGAQPGEIEQVVDGLVRLGFRDIQVAYVDATEDAAVLVGGEAHARSAGIVARVFRRSDEAERWLLAGLQTAAAPR
jgi:hypothetical protein